MYQKIRTFARILRNCVLKKSMSKDRETRMSVLGIQGVFTIFP